MSRGEIGRQLRVKLKAKSSGMPLPPRSKGLKAFPQPPDIAQLIAEGMGPPTSTTRSRVRDYRLISD